MNTTRPKPSAVAANWRLDPDIVFLNHGSFGACPASVLEAQQAMRDRIEREPVRFFCQDLFDLTDRSRSAITRVIGGRPEDYVFLPNATQCVATVLDNALAGIGLEGSRPLGPGDEILMNEHEYPACQNIVRRAAERVGAKVISPAMPWLDGGDPVTSDLLYEIIMNAVTERTRLCMFSLITSPTGLVMPAKRICTALRERGIATLVDAAHGPGAIDFDVDDVGATFLTSNCHKWLCSPKGSALLHVRAEHQQGFRPLALSNYANAPEGTKQRSKFNLEFDYIGTDDPTARLAIADAVELVPKAAQKDWTEITAHNHDLVLAGRNALVRKLGTHIPTTDEVIGPLATVPLPDVPVSRLDAVANRPTIYSNALQDALVERHGVQVPVWVPSAYLGKPFDGKRYIRLSAQVYNIIEQYEYLADALIEELDRESKL
ncbi:MAG: aminotransferase class V-fold PLP-dependent enzyme [Phycisphaerales bacterium]